MIESVEKDFTIFSWIFEASRATGKKTKISSSSSLSLSSIPSSTSISTSSFSTSNILNLESEGPGSLSTCESLLAAAENFKNDVIGASLPCCNYCLYFLFSMKLWQIFCVAIS